MLLLLLLWITCINLVVAVDDVHDEVAIWTTTRAHARCGFYQWNKHNVESHRDGPTTRSIFHVVRMYSIHLCAIIDLLEAARPQICPIFVPPIGIVCSSCRCRHSWQACWLDLPTKMAASSVERCWRTVCGRTVILVPGAIRANVQIQDGGRR